ncbi:cation transporter, partial [Methylicorpusculum sp.]
MDATQTGTLSHGIVVHEVKHRVRLISPVLLKDPERACILEIMLKKRQGIIQVRSVPDIASIAVHFDPRILPKANVLKILDALLGNLGSKTSTVGGKQSASISADCDNNLPVQSFSISINGMTCVSCALLIEMLLKKDKRIVSANVNFATETATVTGRISQQQLFSLIDKMGYQAHAFDTLTQRKFLI